ncbi:IspD/TarI family cytidylyltransferase [Treponema pedis]|uniref:2-C-methyl-D-erythritol 4-phosphate cytidylyltransferase n=1 Tax=Treponema pedis TaxID=409322 RepID=A0A7S7AVK0_9SPIR|nr:IspD/TarI family cytidylyltransferase [Treponema pedis]QOW59704.1 2-C-methyl-D-erythritol 4-phosphate cytidylyltransferase [Treponema pedis]
MKTNKCRFSAVITAAGNSSRMNQDKNSKIKKEYLPLNGNDKNVSVLSECLFKFLNVDIFSKIIITVPKGDLQKAEKIVFSDFRINDLILKNTAELIFIEGGSSRRESVFKALLKLKNTEYVLIHDGARPFVTCDLIKEICKTAEKYGAAVPGYQAVDTQKIVDDKGKIINHLKRSSVFSVQTPQGFNFKKLLDAHSSAARSEKEYTDDSEIYSDFAAPVFVCNGEISNKKITFKDDLQ